jgi:outer membrane protein
MSLTNRSILVCALAGALSLLPAVRAQAQTPAQSIKIAVLDTERVLLGSQTGKKALAELKRLQEQKEGELKAKQQEARDLQKRLEDGRLSLAQDKLAAMEKELEDKAISLKRLQDDATRELQKRRDELLGGVDQQVMPVINLLGRELGFTLIFRKFESGLIYADEGLDITDQVIQRLDAGAGK